jgi:hypothetical protein
MAPEWPFCNPPRRVPHPRGPDSLIEPDFRPRFAPAGPFWPQTADFAAVLAVAFAARIWHSSARCRRVRSPPMSTGCGCSSVVEHDLAKVGVEGSSPFARSRNSQLVVAERAASRACRGLLGSDALISSASAWKRFTKQGCFDPNACGR